MPLKILAPQIIRNFSVNLPSSKSISNRLLILNALSAHPAAIHHLSDADDTLTLQHLLIVKEQEEDCHEGGTTARFLIALRCIQGAITIITGSEALQSRPMTPLFSALKSLGAEFEFLKNENHLPVSIKHGITRGG